MADFAYTYGLSGLMDGTIDLNTHDIRALLVMTNTTADTDDGTGRDANYLNGITLDEMDGANYVRKALANEAVTSVTASNRGKFDADDVTWTALGVGARNVQAVLIYRFVTDDTDSIPIFYIDSGFSPPTGKPANGGDFKVTWNADGIGYSATA